MRIRRSMFLVMKSLMILLCIGVFVFAQENGGGGGDDTSLLELINSAGIIGYLIILMSVAAVALVIEHFINVTRDKLVPPDVVAEVDRLMQEEQYDEALGLCEMDPSFFTNIMAAGIAKVGMGMDEVEKAVEEAASAESIRMNNKISWLNLIGNIAPMMGLLGTVMGMISAFQEIAGNPNPDPSALADGIYKALVTTTMGLIVAIPVLAAYFFFKNRLSQLIAETGIIIEDIFDQLKY